MAYLVARQRLYFNVSTRFGQFQCLIVIPWPLHMQLDNAIPEIDDIPERVAFTKEGITMGYNNFHTPVLLLRKLCLIQRLNSPGLKLATNTGTSFHKSRVF